jgi:hypothetical protein
MQNPESFRLLIPAATLKLWREAAKQHYEGNLARLVREAVGEKLARLEGVRT